MLNKNTVFLCVTDFCNAQCSFCDFWKTKKATNIKKEDIEQTIENLQSKLNCGFVEITGGEPLIYPYIYNLIKAATEKKIITQLMTHGGLLGEDKIQKMDKAGLNIVSISIDHYNENIFNNHRGIENLSQTIQNNLPYFKKTNIITSAGITIAKHNIYDFEKTAKFALSIGFDLVFFSLPIMGTESTYKIGVNSPDSIDFSNKELAQVVKRIITLKKELKKKLVHHELFLNDMLNFYAGVPQKYSCKSGENVFYVDNHLDVYECMVKSNKLGNLKADVELLKDAECYLCPLQCHRESSLMYHGMRSLPFQMDLAMRRESWKIIKHKFVS